MAYQEIIHLPVRSCWDFFLREKLRCEYQKMPHPIRPDFPPDLVLRDQEPPGIILKDETLEGAFWALDFGEEIVVNPYPFPANWRTGIKLNNGWYLRMIGGEIVVSRVPLEEPMAWQFMETAGFSLEMQGEELVYTPGEPFSVVLRDLGGPEIWKVSFGEEISVSPTSGGTSEKTGILLNDGWDWRVRNGEVELSQDISFGPYLFNKQREFIDLRVVNGEAVYVPGKRGSQEFFNIAWALYFREEITVVSWPFVTPMNGIVLARESPTWSLQMRRGEIVLEENLGMLMPFLPKKPDRWRFGLEMVGGELVYTPFNEAMPY